ncbi:hypothetical protein V6O07_20025, partial [Arthrospira platensis SPKY2]
DTRIGPGKTARVHRSANPIPSLATDFVGKTDEGKSGKTGADVDLDDHSGSVGTENGCRMSGSEHHFSSTMSIRSEE